MSVINGKFFWLFIGCAILIRYFIVVLGETYEMYKMRGSNIYTKCTKMVKAVYEDCFIEESKVLIDAEVCRYEIHRYYTPIMKYTYNDIEYSGYSLQRLNESQFKEKHYYQGEEYYIYIDEKKPDNYVIHVVEEYGNLEVIKLFMLLAIPAIIIIFVFLL